jgi:hypothetical protein
VVKIYDPPFTDCKAVYKYINDNLAKWVEEAVRIRTNYVWRVRSDRTAESGASN